MCTYKYKQQHRLFKNSIICNYSEKYAKAFELPHDINGHCIFHSDDVQWKKENNFLDKFNKLIEIIKDSNAKFYDFREFVFVGRENNDTTKYDIIIENLEFDTPLVLGFT